MRSVTNAAATVFFEPKHAKPPEQVLPGQVLHIRDVKLSVGTGPEGSSVLSAAHHNVRLESGSQLVLVPSIASVTAGLPSAKTADKPPGAVADVKPTGTDTLQPGHVVNETEVCAPPDCGVVLGASDSISGAARTAATVSLKELGYPLRADREMLGFDFDAALVYLGPRRLLFTFNPHVIVRRATGETAELRTIRADLIDLDTMKVERTLEWRVFDAGQYLWCVGGGRVLAHVGRELRMYGPDLKLEQKISLDGPLAYLRISPSGKYFAAGILKERHTAAIHQQLEDAESREPEEDVEVKVLGANFGVLATVMRSSREMPPTLSDDGELRIVSIGRNHWRLLEFSWDHQRRVVAELTSTCLPYVSSLPANLFFVIGCDRQADGKWYRMLRPDGRPVLKGWSPAAEFEQAANGSNETFAIGVVRARGSISSDSAFRSSDLERENVGVYRTQNGQRIFAVSIPSPVPTRQTFALSPDGNQLAILTPDEIALYTLPVISARN